VALDLYDTQVEWSNPCNGAVQGREEADMAKETDDGSRYARAVGLRDSRGDERMK
jgi:hypothetical protein